MARGTIIYTQRTVAFPSLPPRERELDDLNVSISDRNGSIEFAWIDLSGFPSGALQVTAFTDSFGVLQDARIQLVLQRIQRRRSTTPDMNARQLIELLEEEGAIPSHYHVSGLLRRDEANEPGERQRLQGLYERAKALE